MDDDAINSRLSALLAVPDPVPDDAFVARIARAADADRLFRRKRARAWRRFTVEGAATAGVALAVLLLWRSGPAMVGGDAPTLGPAATMPLALLLWLAVGMRPAEGR